MNKTFYQILAALITLLISSSALKAQKKDSTLIDLDNVKIIVTENGDTIKKKKGITGMSISIGNNGIKIFDPKKKKKKKHKKLHTGMHFDFGINNINDNTNYTGSTATQGLVIVDTTVRDLNDGDLKLKNGKSINFNFWPVWLKQDIAKHNVQIETGLGFQFFNYRYTTGVRHTDAVPADPNIPPMLASTLKPGFEAVPVDRMDISAKPKNKLGVSYVSVPLMLRFNSNKKNGHRYFIGGGVIGSYKLKSWTKFYGDKDNGNYAINDWMTQLSAEIGVTGIIKLYGTYALQSMYSNDLDRRPFAIGIRL